MTLIFFERAHPKASKKGGKLIFGVQKFDFLTFKFFSPLYKKQNSAILNSYFRHLKCIIQLFLEIYVDVFKHKWSRNGWFLQNTQFEQNLSNQCAALM